MTRMEETEALRARTDVHYNCCQSVLVPFADLCGLDKETAFKLGANFGSGMRHGSTCGAVTGALMVLGLAGKGADEATALMRRFREKNQVLGLRQSAPAGQGAGGGAQVPLRPDGIRSGGAAGGVAGRGIGPADLSDSISSAHRRSAPASGPGALFCASHLRGRERGVSRTVERDQLSARVTVSQ